MDLSESKSSTSGRQRPDYNGAVTRLTNDEWHRLAHRRNSAERVWLLLVDGHLIYRDDRYVIALGAWHLNTHAGRRVVLTSAADRADYVQRSAEAALGAL
jgi:hypothetical protein